MRPFLRRLCQFACLSIASLGASAAEDVFAVRRDGAKYLNPPGSPPDTTTWRDIVPFWWESATAGRARTHPPTPAGHVLDEGAVRAGLAQHAHEPALTWLGHASFLIRIGGRTVLTDPYLTERASPLPVGPSRFAGPGLPPERLPAVDVILVSHNHYDHLDLRALAALPGRDRIDLVVPLGVAGKVRDLGFRSVYEVAWGDLLPLGDLRVHSVPAVHFSGRGLFDRDESLWTGYVLEGDGRRVYFAGDTGTHDTLFREIGRRYGPIDTALVPIGAYEPRSLMQLVHVTPEQAARIGRDVGAQVLVGMHWGTIVLAMEPPFEPPQRFRTEGAALGFAADDLWVMAIGETRALAPSRPRP